MDGCKLELVFPGKYRRERPEPRILISEEKFKDKKSGLDDNLLIHADNLLGLKALERDYTGKIRCIYIDPPYNTKSCFTHYDDSMEHSMWLNMMKERLVILQRLLTEDGSIWISIDDDECHYLKVLCDEIFGRKNFVANVIWEKKNSVYQKSNRLANVHDHILVYSKNANIWRPRLLPRTQEMNAKYKNPDEDPRGPWMADNLTVGMSKDQRPNQYYALIDPASGNVFWPSTRRVWSYIPKSMEKLVKEKRIIFPKDPSKKPSLKRFLGELQDGVLPKSFWSLVECGSNSEAKKEILTFNARDVFETPKPEKLIQRILSIATNCEDIVLDCFAGSGTTGAVAHKMGRRWIMIEMGAHADTHIVPRMKMVISGTDEGGITSKVNWQGGGGFKYCKLAPSLFQKGKLGRPIVNKDYNEEMLQEELCTMEKFSFIAP
jgi:adenine-specific DNA-methyltransferase